MSTSTTEFDKLNARVAALEDDALFTKQPSLKRATGKERVAAIVRVARNELVRAGIDGHAVSIDQLEWAVERHDIRTSGRQATPREVIVAHLDSLVPWAESFTEQADLSRTMFRVASSADPATIAADIRGYSQEPPTATDEEPIVKENPRRRKPDWAATIPEGAGEGVQPESQYASEEARTGTETSGEGTQ